MLQFFNSRALRYEFHALIDDRWQLVGVTNDERENLKRSFDRHDLEDLEARVQRRAEAILKQPGVAGIKVLRERLRGESAGGAEEIFCRKNPPAAKQEQRFIDYQGEAGLCHTVDDLLARPATRIIGTMLRPLLDKLCLSPLELLTIEGASKIVCRADDAISSIVMRVAQIQTRQFGGEIRERASALDTLVTDLRSRIKNAEIVSLRCQGVEDADNFIATINKQYSNGEFRFFAYRGFCLLLHGIGSPGAKLDKIVDIAAASQTFEARAVADAMLADLLDHPIAMQDMLGPQPDLQHAIATLVHLLQGQFSGAHPPLVAMNALLRKDGFTEATGAVYDRIIQSLASKIPLTHGDIGAEWKAIEEFADSLLPSFPTNFRSRAETALDKRQERLQAESFALVENG